MAEGRERAIAQPEGEREPDGTTEPGLTMHQERPRDEPPTSSPPEDPDAAHGGPRADRAHAPERGEQAASSSVRSVPAGALQRWSTVRRSRAWQTRGVWFGIGAWLIALGGIVLVGEDATRGAGVLVLLLAALLGLLAWSPLVVRSPWRSAPAPRALPLLRDTERLVHLSFYLLVVAVAWRADSEYLAHPADTFGGAGWFWLISMAGLIVVSATWPARSASRSPGPLSAVISRESLIVGAIALLALVLRVWNLQGVPFAIHNDEILTAENAINAFLGSSKAPVFSTVWTGINLPALWFTAVAASLQLNGHTLWAVRLPAALFGAATVVPFYGLLREGWGRVAATAGAAIMAVSAVDIQYSRVTLNNIVAPFFWSVCFFFVLRGLRRRRPLDWALAGMAGGLSEYGYYGTRLLPFVLAGFFAYLVATQWRDARGLLASFALTALGYVVAFGPLLAYYSQNRALYLGRGQGVLTWNHVPTSAGDLRDMWSTLWPLMSENLLGMVTHDDQSSLYSAPLLLPGEAALLVLGFALLVRQWRYPPAFLMLLSGLGALFVGGTLVHGVPYIAHWTPAFPAFYAAVALPFAAAADAWRRAFGRRAAPTGVAALGFALGVIALLNVEFYFSRYSGLPDLELRAAQVRWETGLGLAYRVRTVGWSAQGYNGEYNAYLLPGEDGAHLYNPPDQMPLEGAPGKGLGFVINPDIVMFSSLISTLYPGGRWGAVQSPRGPYLFSTYVVSPAQAASRDGVVASLLDPRRPGAFRSFHVRRFGELPGASAPSTAVQWSGNVYVASAGLYRVKVTGGPARVVVDGARLSAPFEADLEPGWHRVVMTARSPAAAHFRLLIGSVQGSLHEISESDLWPVSPATGLAGAVADGSPRGRRRIDPFIGFNAANDPTELGPAQGALTPVRARWTGEVYAPRSGRFTFDVYTDGAARLTVARSYSTLACAAATPADSSVTMPLSRGWYALRLDYTASTSLPGAGWLELFWTPPGAQRSLVPSADFRFSAGADGRMLRPPSRPPSVRCRG